MEGFGHSQQLQAGTAVDKVVDIIEQLNINIFQPLLGLIIHGREFIRRDQRGRAITVNVAKVDNKTSVIGNHAERVHIFDICFTGINHFYHIAIDLIKVITTLML